MVYIVCGEVLGSVLLSLGLVFERVFLSFVSFGRKEK